MDHPSFFKNILEGTYVDFIQQEVTGEDYSTGVQRHAISSGTSLIRAQHPGAIRKLLWQYLSDNNQRERDAQNERNRARRLVETHAEREARLQHQRESQRRCRQRRRNFIQAQGKTDIQSFHIPPSSRIYKVTKTVKRTTCITDADSIHQADAEQVEERIFNVVREGQSIKSILPNDNPTLQTPWSLSFSYSA